MALPEEPFIRFAGLLSDRERLQALEAATVVVCPSPYESLSLLALEALSVGTPILVNARSAVLVEHCVRSNGGLYYADRDEFVECLKLLVGDDTPARGHGRERARLRRAATIAGTSCSASTSGCSRRSRNASAQVLVARAARLGAIETGHCRRPPAEPSSGAGDGRLDAVAVAAPARFRRGRMS